MRSTSSSGRRSHDRIVAQILQHSHGKQLVKDPAAAGAAPITAWELMQYMTPEQLQELRQITEKIALVVPNGSLGFRPHTARSGHGRTLREESDFLNNVTVTACLTHTQ